MDKVVHSFIPTNGISMHVAELGSGPVVVLLHGFPEVWYSWRYQMVALAEAGFRAVAPDFRGYGLTHNTDSSKNDLSDFVDDIAGLLDALVGSSPSADKVCLVAKDFGASIAYDLARLHPHRVQALVSLGIPFVRPHLREKTFHQLPDGHYVKRWGGEPERSMADFGRFDTKTVLKRIYILFSESHMPLATAHQETLDLVDKSNPLPDWLSEQDLEAYASLYMNSGFSYPLDVPYGHLARIAKEPSLTQGLEDEAYMINVPVLLVLGGLDYATSFPGFKLLIEGMMKKDVPNLQITSIEEGSHFVQEQFPKHVNKLILDFILHATLLLSPVDSTF